MISPISTAPLPLLFYKGWDKLLFKSTWKCLINIRLKKMCTRNLHSGNRFTQYQKPSQTEASSRTTSCVPAVPHLMEERAKRHGMLNVQFGHSEFSLLLKISHMDRSGLRPWWKWKIRDIISLSGLLVFVFPGKKPPTVSNGIFSRKNSSQGRSRSGPWWMERLKVFLYLHSAALN